MNNNGLRLNVMIINEDTQDTVVELPLEISPINYFLRFSIPLSIACLNENAISWIYSAFIQFKCTKKKRSINIYSYHIPFLKKKLKCFITTNLFNEQKFLDKIINWLNNGYYLSFKIDQYYMPNRYSYRRNHYLHREYIIGYNLKKQEFIVIGYTNDGHIQKTKMSFEQLKNSIKFNLNKRLLLVYLTKLKPNVEKKFDYVLLYHGIKNYYESKLSIIFRLKAQGSALLFRDVPIFKCYGMDTHFYLKKAIYDISVGKESSRGILINVCAYWEIKKLMVCRLEYMYKNNYFLCSDNEKVLQLIDEFKFIENEFSVYKNLLLKYDIKNDVQIIKNILNRIEKTESIERNALKELLAIMKPVYKQYKNN
jgi:hypothetical protein